MLEEDVQTIIVLCAILVLRHGKIGVRKDRKSYQKWEISREWDSEVSIRSHRGVYLDDDSRGLRLTKWISHQRVDLRWKVTKEDRSLAC